MKSKINVIIEKAKGVSDLEAHNLLVKAVNADPHKEAFIDEGNQNAADVLETVHEKIFNELLEEIYLELDSEEM